MSSAPDGAEEFLYRTGLKDWIDRTVILQRLPRDHVISSFPYIGRRFLYIDKSS